MRSLSVRSGGRWLLVMELALIVAVLAGIGTRLSQDLSPSAVMAQALSEEDEQWVQQKSEEICGLADCSDPDAIKTALRGCLALLTGAGTDPHGARNLCGIYGERTRRGNGLPLEEIPRLVDGVVESEARLFGAAGANSEQVGTLAAGLRRCLVAGELVGESAVTKMRELCAAVYYAADVAWVESRSQIFLLYLLSSGLDADAAAAALTKFSDCLTSRLGKSSSGQWDSAVSTCTELADPARPPRITFVCEPRVQVGKFVTCTAEIGGTDTTLQWSAPGASPSTGTGTSFTFQYSTDGDKRVELTACNGPSPLGCSVEAVLVEVTPVTPVITAANCTAMVPAGGVVSCSATVADTPGLTRRWSAPGGDPTSGNGPSFSTQYAQAGMRTITFRACAGSEPAPGEALPARCAERSVSVTVSAAEPALCRQWDVSGTWQTSQGNGYNPSFAFQQSGTRITGTATVSGGEATRGGFTSPTGPVSGSLVGDRLDVTVTWSTRTGSVTGRYTATVVQGRLTNGSAGGASWTGSGPTRCVS